MIPTRALSRRDVFRMAGAAAVAGIGAGVSGSGPAAAAEPTTPAQALQALKDGNARYVAGTLTSLDEDLAEIRQHTQEQGQSPFAGLLSCADSRVPVELIFDQNIGKLFVTRVAGNFASPEIIASLEYGAAVLGTKVIVALGHGDCGAVKAAADVKPVPGQISALFAPLRPAIVLGGSTLLERIQANAKIQAIVLAQSSPVLADFIKSGQLLVVAAYYDLGTGVVTFLS